ncbi:MAG: hypothetical protein AAEJ43_14005, partial [Gammaproteobacteria bacterium]
LTLAPAEINGNVMAPIVGLDLPSITRSITTERTVAHLTRSKAAVNGGTNPTRAHLPNSVKSLKIASVKAMIAAQKVNAAALAKSSAKMGITLENLNSISLSPATAGTIR